jgi:NADH:ubiquinone oxidoreductase subunit K
MIQYLVLKSIIVLTLGLFVFLIGQSSFHILVIFLYFELLLLFSTVLLIFISKQAIFTVTFFIFIITLAAIKAAIGLSIIITYIKQ